MSISTETKALVTIGKTLETLSPEARLRLLRYFLDLCAEGVPLVPGPLTERDERGG